MNTVPNLFFTYSSQNLLLYEQNLIHTVVAIIVGIIAMITLRYILYFISGFLLLRDEVIAIEKKKHILGDLILMKDIQTELEHEIEQATLKATFQG